MSNEVEAIKGIVASLYAAQRALRALAPEYRWAGMGNLLGDFGEFIAIDHYGLTRAPAGSQGFDAFTPDGRSVQIKANHASSSIGFRGEADLLWGTKTSSAVSARRAADSETLKSWAGWNIAAPRARGIGIETVLTPIRSPKANAICERVIGTLRRDCLDHVIVLGERHLRRVLREYVSYDNETRPHRSLEREPPAGARELPPSSARCRVVAEPILGGLHHRYRWAA